MIEQRQCEWSQDGDTWVSNCNQFTYFDDSSPAGNGYKFCPYCGAKLIEADGNESEQP